MAKIYNKFFDKEINVNRIIGEIHGKDEGPTVIAIGGIHGNEPAGVFACKDVIDEINEKNAQVNGHFYAISGHLWALENGKRFYKEDLNRLWTSSKIQNISNGNTVADSDVDFKEFRELYFLIRSIIEKESGPFYFVDLHSTSSETEPFITMNDSLLNRQFTKQYPVAKILGIEEYLTGPLLSYINELGYVAFGFEAGQHDSVKSIENNVAFLYLTLVFAGVLGNNDCAFNYHNSFLKNKYQDFFEIFYHYSIQKNEDFNMKDGFINFQKVSKKQELAKSGKRKIAAEKSGHIFMPLYQKQGTDGFFLIRSIPKIYLQLSVILRKINFDSILILLPGVKWLSSNKDALVVNKNIARFFAKEFFHLLGYRAREFGEKHIIVRNREAASRNNEYHNALWV